MLFVKVEVLYYMIANLAPKVLVGADVSELFDLMLHLLILYLTVNSNNQL